MHKPTWLRLQSCVPLIAGALILVVLLVSRSGAFAASSAAPSLQSAHSQGGSVAAQRTPIPAGMHAFSGSVPLGPLASALVAAAKSQVGARYAAFGNTPEKGFSCVGLVHWSFAQVGVAVPESAPDLATSFPAVADATPAGAHLLPGDIVLFQNTAWAGYSHASIYIGAGQMVSADSYDTGVRQEPLNTPYWIAHWAGAVRVPLLVQDVAAPGT